MGRTLTRRWFRLWAARRWRLAEQQLSDLSRNAVVSPNFRLCFCCQYAVPVTKYDRKGYKARSRQLLLTSNSAMIFEDAKVKQRIDYAALKGPRPLCLQKDSCFGGCLTRCPAGISVSSLSDGLFVLHVPSDDNKQKVKTTACFCMTLSAWSWDHGLLVYSQGDVILQSDHVIETLTKIAICADKINNININQGRWGAALAAPHRRPHSSLTMLVFLHSIKFTVGQGKEGIIDFTPGSELIVAKAKNGHLSVVRQPNTLVFARKKSLWSHENVPLHTCRRVSGALTHVGGALDHLSDSWHMIGRIWRVILVSISSRRPPDWTPDDICTHTRHQEPSNSWPLPSSNHECGPQSASANQTPAATTEVALASN